MGFKGFFKRFSRSDEEILVEEVRDWAEDVVGARPIGGCPCREPIRVAGAVRRITLRPQESGGGSLEALVSDGTGELRATWTGRVQIPGLHLGKRLVLDGVIADERGRLKMVNPRFEFA